MTLARGSEPVWSADLPSDTILNLLPTSCSHKSLFQNGIQSGRGNLVWGLGVHSETTFDLRGCSRNTMLKMLWFPRRADAIILLPAKVKLSEVRRIMLTSAACTCLVPPITWKSTNFTDPYRVPPAPNFLAYSG